MKEKKFHMSWQMKISKYLKKKSFMYGQVTFILSEHFFWDLNPANF